MAKVSIIIPVYNVEELLPRCLDSVVKQSLEDIEIIIINDGSTDKSLEICQKYAKDDKRIIIYSQENQGVAAARNMGLKLATSEFIGFVDPDDYIDLNTYYLAVKYMKDDIDLLVWDVNLDFEDSYLNHHNFTKGYKDYFKLKKFGKIQMTTDDKITIPDVFWNKLFRKSIIDEHNIDCPVGRLYEDCAFWHKYNLWVKNIYIMPLKLYYYYIRLASLRGQVLTCHNEVEIDRLFMVEHVFDYYYENNKLKENKDFFDRLYLHSLNEACLLTTQKKLLFIIANQLMTKMQKVYKKLGC